MSARFFCLILGSLLFVACGDDDGDDTDVTDEDMGMTSDEDMGPVTGDDMGPVADEDMGSTPGDDMGPITGDDMGTADEPSAEAIAFCDRFETTCEYDSGDAERYDDEAACTTYYDEAAVGCVGCIDTHLTNAETMGLNHCPHAMGMGPCNGPCSAAP
jgi:hypothetical protein